MKYEEAVAWLSGERSMCNAISSEGHGAWQVPIAQADAAMMQQAYFVLKAHAENLLPRRRIGR